jgi:hypothetical protein
MNSHLSSELATTMHREMLGRSDHARRVAAARRLRRAERLSRSVVALTRRAAELVERTHR